MWWRLQPYLMEARWRLQPCPCVVYMYLEGDERHSERMVFLHRVGVRVIGLGLGKGLGVGVGLELWLTRLDADIWLQFEARQSGAGMLLASVTVERFNSRRGVAHFGHLLLITSKDLAPKALRRMCEPLYRRQGGRAPRPAQAYQHHFGGAAADRREERKEHLKTRECGNVNSWQRAGAKAVAGTARFGGVILSTTVQCLRRRPTTSRHVHMHVQRPGSRAAVFVCVLASLASDIQ